MLLGKVHEVISLKRSKRLETFINFKTQRRQEATNDFGNDIYTLMKNAFCGKTKENVRNRMNIIPFKKDEDD